MNEDRQLVKCEHCAHESGIGFDAWCEFGIKKHNIDRAIYCDAYKERSLLEKSDDYIDFEVKNNGNEIILWKGNGNGQKFDRQKFLRFLNQK